jgi:hypothetical protein
MQFTKSDLKTGMVVRFRNESYKIVFGDELSGLENTDSFSSFTNHLLHNEFHTDGDIVAVYNVKQASLIHALLEGYNLTLIWERVGRSDEEKEMDALRAQRDELQEKIEALHAKL